MGADRERVVVLAVISATLLVIDAISIARSVSSNVERYEAFICM